MRDVADRMDFEGLPLIVTDGFDFYEKVVRRVFGPACLYGQVLKPCRNDRIVKVERRALVGAAWRFDEAFRNSEDSSALNTSFIERLNLTIRQSLAYLARRTLSHARSKKKLEDHLELVRCHYNFVRPHRALRFGRETRTPAMQAGLVKRRLTLREIFVCTWRCCTARSKLLTSLCRSQSHPAQHVSGIPSAVILLSISHPIRCSTRCLANVRVRISGPMIAL